MSDSVNLVFKSETRNVDDILKFLRKGLLNTCPPYQRDVVWPIEYMKRFIGSIHRGVHIPPLTFVKPNPAASGKAPYNLLDGKQRVSTIEAYANNGFRAYHPRIGKEVTYQELCSQNELLGTEFDGFGIPVSMMDWVDELTQRDYFLEINQSKQLTKDERMYGGSFHAAHLLEFISNSVPDWVNPFGKKAKKFNKNRMSRIAFTHGPLFKVYGTALNEVLPLMTSKRGVSSPEREKSAKFLQNALIESGHAYGQPITDDVLKNIGIKDAVENYIRTTKALVRIAAMDDKLEHVEISVLRDLICYFMYSNEIGEITTPMLNEFPKVFYGILLKYQTSLQTDGKLSGGRQNFGDLNVERFQPLDKLVRLECVKNDIELTTKRNLPTDLERAQAIAQSNGYCPICNAKLTPENRAVDHVDPKCKFSHTVYVCLCNYCNGRKKDFSEAELKKFYDYTSANKL